VGDDCLGGYINLSSTWDYRISSTMNGCYRIRHYDGSDKTVTLTAGKYTYSTLATHVQTQLNASSSNWTVAYDYSGGTYRFTISRSSSATLRFSQTTSAAWDLLGFTLAADTAGTSFPAQEMRIHSAERYVIDLGLMQAPTFFGVISALSEAFNVSENATLKLYGDNVLYDVSSPTLGWSSPALSVTLDRADAGILEHLDDQADVTYRYFCFEIVDRLNPVGPDGLKIGYIYLGDHTTLTTTSIAQVPPREWPITAGFFSRDSRI
jgi:hypothetical protein